MSDNPRASGHPSDIPSSRPVDPVSNNQSPVSTGYTRNDSAKDTGRISRLHLRNIIIGAITTVIGSTTVYYLTQYRYRSHGDETLIRKEATIETWRSYVGYENAYFQNLISYQSVAQTEGRDAFLKAMTGETEKFVTDVEDLKKRKNIDEDLVKAFSKRIESEKAAIPAVRDYYKNLTDIENSKQSIKGKKDNITNEMIRFVGLSSGMYERSLNDMKEIAKVLAGRYGSSFSMDDFLLVQKAPQLLKANDSLIRILQNVIIDSSGNIIENKNFTKNVNRDNLVGKWTTSDAVIVFSKDGKMSWNANDGNKANGTWKIQNDKLEIDAITSTDTKKVHWRFNLAHITITSFTVVLDGPPYNIYVLTRTLED